MESYVTGYWSYLQWDHMLLDTGFTYNGIICYWILVLLTMGSYVTGYWFYLQWDHMLLDTGLTYNGIICYWILNHTMSDIGKDSSSVKDIVTAVRNEVCALKLQLQIFKMKTLA